MGRFAKIGSLIIFSIATCFAENPVVQTNFTADPAPMVYNDTVFLYTGHDEDTTPSSGFYMHNYLLYTSTDLVNWRDRGIAASLKNFSWAPSNGAWAAQCVYRNGTFYYYCAIQGYGIGVLVANTPYGPFTDPLGHALLNHSWNDIDPTVFIDDDGQAYMYWGNPQCYWVRLNQDMISYSGRIDSIVPRLNTYQEGPWFYKRNNRYYLAWSSTCCPEGIGYAMSASATGPWTYAGSIMDGNPGSSGNQPGIFDYKGKSYTFGFNYAINFSLTTVHRERRSVCLAALTYNTDGTIPKLPWFGGNLPEPGVPQVGALNPYDTTQAETICFERGVRTEVCSEGGIDVDSIHNGDFIKVKGVDFGTGANSFIGRVASATSGGNIELRLDDVGSTFEAEAAALSGTAAVATDHTGSTGTGFVAGFFNSTTAQVLFTIPAPSAGQYSVQLRYSAGNGASSNTGLYVNGTQITTLSCPATASWDTWSTVTQTVTLNAGNNTIEYKAVTSSTACINLDNITIPSITGFLVGSCAVAGTGGWQTWTTRTCTVTGATGIHDLYLRFTGGSGLLFNFNWWKFNSATEIGTPTGTKGESGNSIKVVTNGGTITLLQLDFSQPVSQGNLKICLFDLTGLMAATLFKGRLSSSHLTLPMNRREIGRGIYLITVSLNDRITLTKTFTLL